MKRSLILTLLILIAGIGLRWRSGSRAVELDGKFTALKAEAAALGLDAEAISEARIPVADAVAQAVPPREREARAAHDAEIKAFARELIDFAIEMKAREKSGMNRPDAALQERIVKMISRFLDLGEADLRSVVGEVKASSELEDKTKRDMLGMTIMMLGQTDPEAGLRLFGEVREFLGGDSAPQHVITGLITNWAAKDPAAALAWMDRPENAETAGEETRAMLAAGIARKDPALALKTLLAGKSGNKKDDEAARMIGMATVPEQRNALLESFANWTPDPALSAAEKSEAVARLHSLQSAALAGLANGLVTGDVAESTAWITRAGLSEKQRAEVIDKVAGSLWGKDPAPWLTWIGENTADETKLAELTQKIVPQWTQRDFNAVGEWINVQPDGPGRVAAIQSFATTLAPHEPEAAARWAITLPEGSGREALLQNIYSKWRGKDEAAAAAFATENGLTP